MLRDWYWRSLGSSYTGYTEGMGRRDGGRDKGKVFGKIWQRLGTCFWGLSGQMQVQIDQRWSWPLRERSAKLVSPSVTMTTWFSNPWIHIMMSFEVMKRYYVFTRYAHHIHDMSQQFLRLMHVYSRYTSFLHRDIWSYMCSWRGWLLK